MIVVENRIEVRAGYAEAVLERFKAPKSVHTFPGFVRMDVLHAKASEETEEIRVCTTWEKEEDFQAWANSDSFQHAHKRREGAQGAGGHGGHGHGGQQAAESASPIVGNKVTIYQVAVSHLPESAPAKAGSN
ncbi:antibiotic biosynthesis monooxygenase [Paenibacillus montanisoli]|uniref:antibiotic biosynthesis monooxygenase n=1 Tax=Paenibacillus montanisoli TaxID=2081970 RepID=UPI001F0C181D|nr:antibiotic biosynthesis monooxygenase [Paenibacillus montanisoli]